MSAVQVDLFDDSAEMIGIILDSARVAFADLERLKGDALIAAINELRLMLREPTARHSPKHS